MARMYVSKKTAKLYENAADGSQKTVLIFGDEVETGNAAGNGRVEASFRGLSGYMDADSLGKKPALELYFIDVGQGDSTFIVTPKRKKILIDGGINNRAFGFLSWKYRLDRAAAPIDIDLLVLSHADGDHIKGLAPIIRHPMINVKKVIHNGIATYGKGAFATGLGKRDGTKKYLTTRHDTINDLDGANLSDAFGTWRDAIAAEGTAYNAVDSGTGMIDVGDPAIGIEVVGPRLDTLGGKPAYRWLGGEAPTINGHSVVLRIDYGDVSVLLTGDLNKKGTSNLLEDPATEARVSAHVYKVPHHGSDDYQLSFLRMIRPQISVISSGDSPDYGHPRAIAVGALGKESRSAKPLIFSTEIAASFVEDTADKKKKSRKKIEEERKEADAAPGLEALDVSAPGSGSEGRIRFKRRLHGMINVRTDGEKLYAARRVSSGSMWESYDAKAEQ